MSIQELEAEALKLSPAEREELVRRLLGHLNQDDSVDPLLGLGSDPVVCGVTDAQRWNEAFANSQDLLAELAAEAREEDRAGRTLPLDPEGM